MDRDKNKKRVLVIGIDGATWDIFDENLLENHMPVLNRLKNAGTSGLLWSTEPPITWAAWSTFLTGCEPATHGIFSTEKYNFADDSLKMITAADTVVANAWEILSEQGYKIISIGVPYTYPCPKVNGIIVAGFGCPGMDSDITFPVEFKKELFSRVPGYEILADWKEQKRYSFDEFESGLKSVETRFNQRVAAAKLADAKVDWDVLMIHFHNTDLMEHRIWPYLDSKTRDSFPQHRDRAFKAYEVLDKKIGELLDMAGNNAIVVFVSDHGLCRQTAKVRPNVMLCEWGYLKRKGLIKRKLEKFFAAKVNKLKQPDERIFDWANSRAMVITMTTNGHLYLNVKGRQPHGIIEPGAEYDTVIEDLRKRFSQYINPLTNRPVFQKVGTSGEIYGTKDPVEHGDLILVPDEGIEIRVSASTKDHAIKPMNKDSLVGWHNYRGIYGFSGPGIKNGFSYDTKITNILPTIYAAMGARLPGYMDGKVLQDIFDREISVEYQADPAAMRRKKTESAKLTSRQEEDILKRLKALGYIE